ncbi:MAG TPA: glycerophosphodiester phosphodiesterase family protein [Nitrospiria bacterium]|nr:glycerophosphodiester phosphodiesterase family protein [Nitrospiria bacterium]
MIPKSIRAVPWTADAPAVIAHRGASAVAPENTLAAFRLAVRAGAPVVEFDVHQTRDHRLVVVHDASLQRTTGVRRAVEHLTAREIIGLDAGSWFGPEHRGARIPTLDQVLGALTGRAALNIELKAGTRRLYPGLESRVLALVRRSGWRERVLVSSFHVRYLQRLRRLDATIAIGVLIHPWSLRGALSRAKRLAAASIHPPARVVTADLVRRIHAAGCAVLPYTVDDAAEKRRLVRLGVDGFFTNRP